MRQEENIDIVEAKKENIYGPDISPQCAHLAHDKDSHMESIKKGRSTTLQGEMEKNEDERTDIKIDEQVNEERGDMVVAKNKFKVKKRTTRGQ